MTSSLKNVYTPKDIDVRELTLFNFSVGKQLSFVDLTRSTIEFSVYEDLWSNFMSADITVQDNQGMIETIPIFGEELIRIKFKTPTFKNFIDKLFVIYKIDKRQSMNERTDVYTLSLISIENIVSMISTVDDSYVGKEISEIVNLVYFNYIYNSSKTFGRLNEFKFNAEPRDIFVEDTQGLQSFIAPTNTPFDFMSYLTTEAQSVEYEESDFVLYEDRDKFNFRTISSLIDTDPVDSFYLADPSAKQYSDTKVKKYQIIEKLQYDNQFDLIERIASGMYDNTVKTIDPILKKYEEIDFNYYNETLPPSTFKGLGNWPVISQWSVYKNLNGESYSKYIVGNLSDDEYYQTSYLDNRTIDADRNVFDPYTRYPFRKHLFLNTRTSKLSQLHNGIRLSISIPGNTDLKVGDVINVFVPQNRATVENEAKYNFFFGQEKPKFLITALTHRYNYNEDLYYTMLEVVKDTFDKQIRDNTDKEEIFT